MKSKVINHTELNIASNIKTFSLGYNGKDGKFKRWNVVTRQTLPKAITKDFKPDCVVVVASDIDTDELVLLKQYRATVDGPMIEFPAGKIDEGESVEEAAARELFEETGLQMFRCYDKSEVLYSSSGLTDESVVFVFCTCTGEISKEMQEDTEEIEAFFFNRNSIEELFEQRYFKEPVSFCVRAWTIIAFNSNSALER